VGEFFFFLLTPVNTFLQIEAAAVVEREKMCVAKQGLRVAQIGATCV
jgi:hypothetical protein